MLLTINRPHISSHNPLPLFSVVVVLQRGEDEMAAVVLLKWDVFRLHHICRNLSFILRIQLPNSELLHCPFFEVFVRAVPPGAAGIGKSISDIRRTFNTIKPMRIISSGKMYSLTERLGPLSHQNTQPSRPWGLRLRTSTLQRFFWFVWEAFPLRS